ISIYFLRKTLFAQPERIGKIGVLKYLFFAVPITISIGVLLNSDILLAKYYLQPIEAGHYVAASLIGTFAFFIMAAVVKVMFPKVANFNSNGKDTLPLLKESVQYTALLTGILTLAFLLVPDLASKFLFSEEYSISGLLRWYAPATFFLAMTTVFVMYLVALRKFSILYPVAGFAILKVFILARFHASASEIVAAVFWVNFALFLVILVLYKDIILLAMKKRREYFNYAELLQSR
ncbi:MAG: hypothetical protein AABX51_08875, partial [Nanoarchaeota archaeon]